MNSGDFFEAFHNAKVLCIGDVMLDEYIYGTVDRISPEAPIPIFDIKEKKLRIGGAGNTAFNIAALGARCTFVSMVGVDDTGRQISRLLGENPYIRPWITNSKVHESTLKTRYIANPQQVLRVDSGKTMAITRQQEASLVNEIDQMIPDHDVLVISDYDKGLLTPALIRYCIVAANTLNKPVIVDPKMRAASLYADATVITPNRGEFDYLAPNGLTAFDRARRLINENGFKAVLLTRSEEGMTLIEKNRFRFTERHHQPRVHEVVDVTGAGDTVVAVLAIGMAIGLSIGTASYLSNIAAGLVVGKSGTATINIKELKDAYEKI